jgi:hypothetical protein
VSPLLDSIGSVKGFGFGALLDIFEATGSYDALASYTVPSGGVSTITFAGLPTGGQYKHLQIRVIAKSAGAFTQGRVKINSDTSSVYTLHQITGNGSSASANGYANEAGPITIPIRMPDTANIFGVIVMDILDYQDTNKFKTIRTLGGADLNGSGSVIFSSNLWRSTSAITQLDFDGNGENFAQHSQFALYGIRG